MKENNERAPGSGADIALDLPPFSEFNLGWELDKALQKMGYEIATPIQARAIPVALEGKDIVGQARTGTGKTAAFAIPIIKGLRNRAPRFPKALILAPTRELATQIKVETQRLGEFKKCRVIDIVGGRSIVYQSRRLRKGAHIIVGTPGRVIDMSERGALILDDVETVTLDEADEMLNMGFYEDVEKILRMTPRDRQTFLFSATIDERVTSIGFNHMRAPKIIRLKEPQADSPIKEIFHITRPADRFRALLDLLDRESAGQSLIFCETKREVDSLALALKRRDYPAEAIHGDFRQARRDKVMQKYKNAEIDILVATDVAARGIHVDNISTVINYRLPDDPTTYVHRIGRTGRVGKSGVAITLCALDQKYLLPSFKSAVQARRERRG